MYSTRTTPLELGAWMNCSSATKMPTCDAPRDSVWKKTRSPGCRSSIAMFCPILNCSSTCRGSATPYCANTHWVKPLQSKPAGSLPPLRYGVPRKPSAVAISASSCVRVGRGGVTGAVAEGSDVDGVDGEATAVDPAGVGNGRGVAATPLDAHADVIAASAKSDVKTSRRALVRCFIAFKQLSARRSTIRSGSIR